VSGRVGKLSAFCRIQEERERKLRENPAAFADVIEPVFVDIEQKLCRKEQVSKHVSWHRFKNNADLC
jgi:hypothetical protein